MTTLTHYVARLTDNDGALLVDFVNGPIRLSKSRQTSAAKYPFNQTFSIYSTHAANVALRMSALQGIMRVFNDASAAITSNHAPNYIWLELYEEDEFPKRALVYAGDIALDNPLQTGTGATEGSVVIKRGPWESTTPVSLTYAATNMLRGHRLLPPLGDMPGRISQMTVGNISSSMTAYHLIAGIRPHNRGMTTFDPYFAISTTSGTLTVNVETLVDGSTIADIHPGALGTAFQGRYYIHVRGTNNMALLKLRLKITNDESIVPNLAPGVWTNEEYLAVGGFHAYFGPIDIPIAGGLATLSNGVLENTKIEAYATALDTTGTATVTVSSYVLIPESAHVHTDQAIFQGGTANDIYQYVETMADDRLQAYGYDPTGEQIVSQTGFKLLNNWQYPPEGGIFVLSSDDAPTSPESSVDLTFSIYPRWHLYRGREF